MRKVLSLAVAGTVLALSPAVYAQATNSTGTVGTNVGNSIKQPMVVQTDNSKVHIQPNAISKILTTVPRGQQVTMIGTANGGAWAHVMVGGLDGYMDMKELQKPTQ